MSEEPGEYKVARWFSEKETPKNKQVELDLKLNEATSQYINDLVATGYYADISDVANEIFRREFASDIRKKFLEIRANREKSKEDND